MSGIHGELHRGLHGTNSNERSVVREIAEEITKSNGVLIRRRGRMFPQTNQQRRISHDHRPIPECLRVTLGVGRKELLMRCRRSFSRYRCSVVLLLPDRPRRHIPSDHRCSQLCLAAPVTRTYAPSFTNRLAEARPMLPVHRSQMKSLLEAYLLSSPCGLLLSGMHASALRRINVSRHPRRPVDGGR
jgi:hypothetical protein